MYKIFSIIILFLICSSLAVHHELAPEIKKCSKSDPELTKCMNTSMNAALRYYINGSKELGFPSFEPFYIEKLEFTADPGKSVRLNQKYEHVYFHGFSTAEIRNFSLIMNDKICSWDTEIFTPTSVMNADYELTGQILLFPINGHGKCNLTINGILNRHHADCERFEKKGKTHIKLKNYSINMNVEYCHFDFQGLIPGNEKISQELGKTINENAMEIFKDVKGGFEQVLSRLHEDISNNLFARIPENELFLP